VDCCRLEPHAEVSGWQLFLEIGGEIVLPDVQVTCGKSAGSLIDYAVAAKSVAKLIMVKGVLGVPWKVHCGLRVKKEGSSTAWWRRALVLPRPHPALARPPTARDPLSKCYPRKQAALQRRRAALPLDHQEAFADLYSVEAALEPPGDELAITAERWTGSCPSVEEPCASTAEMRMIFGTPIVGWAHEGNDGLTQTYGSWVDQVEQVALDHIIVLYEGIECLTSDQLAQGLTQMDAIVEFTPTYVAANAVADPIAIMAAKAERWGKIWTDAVDTPASTVTSPARIRLRAAEEVIPPLQTEQLQAAMRATGHKKARGADGLGAGGLARLPFQAWPRCQSSCGRGLARLSRRSGGPSVALDEAAQGQNLSFLVLLLDIEKFYDSVSLVGLLQVGLDFGFSPTVVGSEVQVYLYPRYLRERGLLSEAIFPTRSIVAGSSQGTPFSKLALCQILERVHQGPPSAGLWAFIGDTVGRCDGAADSALPGTGAIGTTLTQGSQEQRLVVSTKSVLLGSSAKLAKKSARRPSCARRPCQ
ncbi:unnamed protein product, partial [Prorocentrum cordatum]